MASGMERLEHLGTFGIFRETFKVIFARKKIFALATLFLILPLSAILLVNSKVTRVILLNTLETDDGSPLDADGNIPEVMAIQYNKNGWWLVPAIMIIYFSIVIIFSLLVTSVVSYTVACVYVPIEVFFMKLVTAGLKVWFRLMVTFLWILVVFVIYTLIFIGLLFLCSLPPGIIQAVLLVILIIAYIIGSVYLTILTQLAFVVSVVENSYGRMALSKSKTLMKGKLWSIVGFLVLFIVCSGLVEFAFKILVVVSSIIELLAVRILIAVALCFVFALVTLVGQVAFGVIYFVCKSYHNETLDMDVLRTRLGFRQGMNYIEAEQYHA